MIVLAPVFVIGAGIIAAILVLLIRAFMDSLREFGHKRLLISIALGVVVLVVVLSILGVELPRE